MNVGKNGWLGVAVAAGVIWVGGSCVSYDVTRANTYIGPSKPVATRAVASPASRPGVSVPAVTADGTIRVDVYAAIVMALNNNRELAVEKYTPPIVQTFEAQELGAFDPVLSGRVVAGHTTARQGVIGGSNVNSTSGAMEATLTEFLPTGTRVGVGVSATAGRDRYAGGQNSARIGLTATQALMRGYGLDVNLASLRQARLDTLSSEYELRGFAQAVVARTEQAYWDYVEAQRQVAIVERSWQLAKDQLSQTDERIRVGRLGETERAAAEAEVAVQELARIEARSAVDRTRVVLLRLLNPPGPNALGRVLEIQIGPQAIGKAADAKIDPLEEHLALAQRMRPDLNQARLLVSRNELEIVKTRNGLLPRLDLFVTLGKSGYADSFGEAASGVATRGDFDAAVGVSGEIPLGNRAARAQLDRSVLNMDMSRQAVANLSQLVETDVRLGYIELVRAREQLIAAGANRRLQAEKERAEQEKFLAQRSTSLQVALVQRDRLAAEIIETRAGTSYLKAFVELYRLEGSLLERRGIVAPGREPVENSNRPPR
ncbi:MAG: TolC family protein [Planctomycetota bacterium]